MINKDTRSIDGLNVNKVYVNIFDESALAALSSISFITEVIGLDRKYFERNFRSFNLVFKSKN